MTQIIVPEGFGHISDIGLHPLALILTLSMGLLLILLPRKYVIIPLLIGSIFIPINQRFIIAGLDFFMFRMLILFGWFRLLLKREVFELKINILDILVVSFYFFLTLIYTLQWATTQAMISKMGIAFDALGSYFIYRVLIRNYEDIEVLIKILIFISIPLSLFMLLEYFSARNMFSIFGGVPEITVVRDGRLRCQGPFFHPIMAGTFGAAIFPFSFYRWFTDYKGKIFAVIGFISSSIIVATSSSSGPAIALIVAILGISFWIFRNFMYIFRWGLLCLVILLHLVMEAPVWALIARVKVFGSSTGYYRYELIDEFINNFSEWWLLGTRSTAHWGAYGLWDVTNQYIRYSIDGGLITLVIMIVLIIFCFNIIGKAMDIIKYDSIEKKLLWSLGVSLFVHITSFMSVSYFDQLVIMWYMILGIVGSIYSYNRLILHKLSILNEKMNE